MSNDTTPDLLAEDMRTWCSPYGIAGRYADQLVEELDRIAASQEIALCICGHTHGEHADPDACFALDNGDTCGCDGFKTASQSREA